MTNPNQLQHFTIDENIPLSEQGSWRSNIHRMDARSAYALEMALATGRPLLVRGEPGIGKSQLARAAAAKLERVFVSEVVNVATEGQDLLWRYDPVARLNDAQILASEFHARQALTSSGGEEKQEQASSPSSHDYLHPRHYLNPGVLWWVFDWNKAEMQYDACRHKVYKPDTSHGGKPENGIVLLIDEIDKADPSLPNSLLEVLGNGGFQVPMLGESVGGKHVKHKPLVIITTNEERELPPAFLRRCLVLNLSLDNREMLHEWWHKQSVQDSQAFPPVELGQFDVDAALKKWLDVERAEVHFPTKFASSVKERTADYLLADRKAATNEGLVKPGQAEYLDLLTALHEMTDAQLGAEERQQYQLDLLDKIRDYALVKAER